MVLGLVVLGLISVQQTLLLASMARAMDKQTAWRLARLLALHQTECWLQCELAVESRQLQQERSCIGALLCRLWATATGSFAGNRLVRWSAFRRGESAHTVSSDHSLPCCGCCCTAAVLHPVACTDMNPRRLQQLANVIDSAFLNGSFAEVCGPSYAVQNSRLAPEDGEGYERACRHATAGFEPLTNSVIFYRPCWRKAPSLRCPLQADGVYCTNKLSWLAHTMGHEMVHCIVHHACPETRNMPSYVQNHGHGPVFVQLNKHIFGHHTTRYKAGWGRLHPQLQVQPLKVTNLLQLEEPEPTSERAARWWQWCIT
jgi:hypothetical protein